MLTSSATSGGMTKLLGRADRFEFQGYQCPDSVHHEGRLRVWSQCTVSVRVAGQKVETRLFGAIIERDGHYKFAGFANDL